MLTIPHNQTESNQDYAQCVTELPLMNCLTYVCWSKGQYGCIIDNEQTLLHSGFFEGFLFKVFTKLNISAKLYVHKMPFDLLLN